MEVWLYPLLGEQVPTDGLSGWLAAAGSTVGLTILVFVLRWLLYTHLPEKDKQMKELIASKDSLAKDLADATEKRIDAMAALFRQEMTDTRKEYRESLQSILGHCERETAKISEAIRNEVAKLGNHNE